MKALIVGISLLYAGSFAVNYHNNHNRMYVDGANAIFTKVDGAFSTTGLLSVDGDLLVMKKNLFSKKVLVDQRQDGSVNYIFKKGAIDEIVYVRGQADDGIFLDADRSLKREKERFRDMYEMYMLRHTIHI